MGDEQPRPPRASVSYPVQRRPTALRDDGEAGVHANEQGGGRASRSWFDEMHRAPGMPFAVAGGLLAGALLALVLFRGGEPTNASAAAVARDRAGEGAAPNPEASAAPSVAADRAGAAPQPGAVAVSPGAARQAAGVLPPGDDRSVAGADGAHRPDDTGAEDASADNAAHAPDGPAEDDFEVVPDGPAAPERPRTEGPVELTLAFEVEPADVERLRIRVNGTDIDGKTHRLRLDDDDAVVIEARARGYRTWRRRLRPRTDRTVRIKLRPPTRALPGSSIDL